MNNVEYLIRGLLSISTFLNTLFLIREIYNIREIRQLFICEHCGKMNYTINNGLKCSECNKVYKNRKGTWEHFLLFRISEIDTSIKRVNYTYKKCIKNSKIQLIMCCIFEIILISSMIITYINGV